MGRGGSWLKLESSIFMSISVYILGRYAWDMNSMLWPKPLLPANCREPRDGGDVDISSISSSLSFSMILEANENLLKSRILITQFRYRESTASDQELAYISCMEAEFWLVGHVLFMAVSWSMKGMNVVLPYPLNSTIMICHKNMSRTWINWLSKKLNVCEIHFCMSSISCLLDWCDSVHLKRKRNTSFTIKTRRNYKTAMSIMQIHFSFSSIWCCILFTHKTCYIYLTILLVLWNHRTG